MRPLLPATLLLAAAAGCARSPDQVPPSPATDTVAAAPAAPAAQPRPRLSPPDSVVTAVGPAQLRIVYGRPSVRGREIFGALVPYDRVWRTGANEATSLVTTADLEIGGVPVPAGRYTLYTIPGREQWTLIVNRQTGQWGTDYDPSQDLARIPMRVAPLAQPVEQFEIRVVPLGDGTATLALAWERTRAEVDVRAR